MSIIQPSNQVPTFTILLKAEKKKVEGLSIEDVHESKDHDSFVVFKTANNKKWKLQLNEFSFVFPAAKATIIVQPESIVNQPEPITP